MKLLSIFLSVALLCGLTDAELLRSPSSDKTASTPTAENQRRLFFRSININQIIEALLPALNAAISNTIASNLNDVDLRVDFIQNLANLNVGPNCTATGLVDYHLGTLSGLDEFQIDSIDLVPGTDSLDISFLGLRGASWSGVWNVRGRFGGNVEIGSDATLSADACGVPLQETSSGKISATNPGLDIRIAVDGESPNIFSLASSLAESITVEDARFNFDTIVADVLGLFGNDLQLDLTTIFDGLFTDTLLNQILPLLLELLQNVLQGGLQF